MNYRIWTATGLVTAAVLLVIGYQAGRKPAMPQPTRIVEERDDYAGRREWIETMHRTAPGVDWREMDEETRRSMYAEKLPRLQEAAGQGLLKGSPVESIADGYLTGQWVEKGSNNQSGRVRCADIDFAGNRLFLGSDGGQVWVGTPDGSGWKTISDPYRISNILFIRAFPNQSGGTRVLAANHKVRMNYTDDMGVTWKTGEGLSTYYRDFQLLRAITQSDGTIYVLVYKDGYHSLLRSTDLGSRFTRLIRTAGSANADIWTDRFGKDTVFLLDKNKLYSLKDTTAWESRSDVNLNFATGEIQSLQLAGNRINGVNRLYAMFRLEKSSRFYGSNPGGSFWTYRGMLEKGPFMGNSFGVSTINPNILGFGEVEAHLSTDGGATWKSVNGWGEYYGDVRAKLHADIPEIEFFRKPDGTELVFISTDGGTFVSEDQMNSVKNVSLQGLNISQYYTTYTHRTLTNVIYAGAQDQGFQKSWQENDGVVDFEQTISGDYGHIVSSDGGKSMWTVYPGFAMYYPDAATSNAMATLGFDEMGMKNQFWMPPLMADPYRPNRVYLGGGTSTTGCRLWLLEHTAGSVKATELPTDFSNGDNNARISAMAVSPINKDYLYVLTSAGRLFTSTDNGLTFTMSSNRGPDSHYFYGNSIVPSPRDINTIYVAGSGYSGYPAWVSKDGGQTFQQISTGLKNSLIFEMTSNTDGSMLFAASEVGPFVYITAKNQWFDLSGISAPQQTYWSVDYIPALRTARFGTYGRGIWDFRISTFSGTGEVIAGAGGLRVNAWPNPFADQLNISVAEGFSGREVIRVIGLDGKESARIQPAAGTDVQLDLSDLADGIYLVDVQSGNGRETLRVVKSGR